MRRRVSDEEIDHVLELLAENDSPICLDHLFLGPTPNITISMNSLTMFLSKNGIRPANGISYCQIPFRAR